MPPKCFSDHPGDVLHGFNLGTHHVGTPLLEHLGNGVDLFAIKDLAQRCSTEQGTDRTFGRDVGDQRIEIGSLRRIQPVAVLEQRPTQALKVGTGLLFESLVSSLVAASKSTPRTNHGSITPNAASNRLLCVTCLRLVYAEGGTIPPIGNSTEANIAMANTIKYRVRGFSGKRWQRPARLPWRSGEPSLLNHSSARQHGSLPRCLGLITYSSMSSSSCAAFGRYNLYCAQRRKKRCVHSLQYAGLSSIARMGGTTPHFGRQVVRAATGLEHKRGAIGPLKLFFKHSFGPMLERSERILNQLAGSAVKDAASLIG
ncbi:hypothetical protein HDG41_008112 [Paraburkholderia sp. JPY162]|uniref:Uncharacterized protein n=2 Tax=Paraburkholderia youngii TaxID=2782701 RepID=A0A7W8LG54_9BURK|nr:hypothetical protein [Paraburkholderia youngii]